MAASTRRGCPPAAPKAGAGSSRARTSQRGCSPPGGAGLRWAQLAEAAAALARALAEYRLQWRIAEQVAAGCPTGTDGHLAALAVGTALRPPLRNHPGGRWRLCGLVDGLPVTLDEFDSPDLAEGCAVAHRTGAAAQAYWAERVAGSRSIGVGWGVARIVRCYAICG